MSRLNQLTSLLADAIEKAEDGELTDRDLLRLDLEWLRIMRND